MRFFRAGQRRTARRTRGQAIVEFALTLPLFFLVIASTIEFALLFITYYSETRLARESARWLAVHSSTTTDSQFAAYVQSNMLPGLVNGAPTQVTAGSLNQDAVWQVGSMMVQFTPCVPAAGVCQDPARYSGSTLYVQMSYNAANLLFLPTTFHLGSTAVHMPTSLPNYRVYVMTE